MMKRFQEHMMTNHPLRLGKHKATFNAASDASFLASGESNQSTKGDAQHAKSAPSKN
jgi:hypothetical protein